MSGRTESGLKVFLWLLFGAVSAIVCAIASLLIFASMYPGVKGPHITGEQTNAALAVGAAIGVAAVVLIRWLSKRAPSR